MTHIIIKNIGPIKEVELDLNKINVFMGPQSSGKSTIAKIISYCSWYEKNSILETRPQIDFYKELIEFHNFEDAYFGDDSLIEYKSNNIHIVFNGSNKDSVREEITVGPDNIFRNEKIEYIPAERNIVVISGIGKYNEKLNNVLGFLYDWFKAKQKKKADTMFHLPLASLNNTAYYYSQEDDADRIVLENGKTILLQHASSGLMSVVPLILVYNYVMRDVYLTKRPQSPFEIINLQSKLDLFDNELRDRLSDVLSSSAATRSRLKDIRGRITKDTPEEIKNNIENIEETLLEMQKDMNKKLGFDSDYNYSKIIVEEPELNLFPESQKDLVYYMLSEFNESEKEHCLVITTHSPYVLFSLNNCMMGGLVEGKIPDEEKKSFASFKSWIDPKKVSIYEIHDGTLKCIQDEDGIIEDNYLNQAYKENSSEYLSLLNYYDDEE